MQIFYCRRHPFEEPARCGSGSAHANKVIRTEPYRLQVVQCRDVIGAEIRTVAQVAEHPSVGTGLARNKHDDIVGPGKGGKFFVPGCDLRADGLMDAEPVAADLGKTLGQGGELHGTLGRLREEFDLVRFVQNAGGDYVLELVFVLEHYRVPVRMADEAEHLGMAYPSEYQHFVIAVAGVVGRFDVLLELEDHRAGAVDYPESQLAGDVIYVRGYAVSADEKGLTCHIGQGFKVVEVYRDQTHCPKACNFFFVVHYRSEAEEFLSSAG